MKKKKTPVTPTLCRSDERHDYAAMTLVQAGKAVELGRRGGCKRQTEVETGAKSVRWRWAGCARALRNTRHRANVRTVGMVMSNPCLAFFLLILFLDNMADPASTFNSLSASLSLLHALSLHLKSNPTTPQPVLLETIQTLTSVRKALDEHLLTNEPAAVTAHLATLDKSLATLPPPLQASLKSNGLLPLLGTTQNSFTDLHTLSTTTETRTLQSLQRTALQIPPGHTFYSWFDQRPANSPPPLCHTSYTFKQAPPSGYTTLLNLLADVRSLERSKSFCKLLLTDTITTLKLETVDYR